jgi:ferredoxin
MVFPSIGGTTMALKITEDCINCDACKSECPNEAIFEPGDEYELDGKTNSALSDEFYYIVPELCTECKGFHDEEQCVAVCPVDCCVPDEEHEESEEELMEKAKKLHPDKTF